MVVDAVQWHGEGDYPAVKVSCGDAFIETLEGRMMVSQGDWIITGVQGEYYPCKPDIFEMTYEAVCYSAKSEKMEDGMWNYLKALFGIEDSPAVPRTYFFDAEDSLVDYLTNQAIEGLKERVTSYQLLRERAYKILSILLSGSAASIFLFINAIKLTGIAKVNWGFFVFFVGWSICSIILIYGCIKSIGRETIHASPDTLYVAIEDGSKTTLEEIKRLRLQEYCENNNKMGNTQRVMHILLNISITGAVISAIVSAGVSSYFLLFSL